ncbi:alpha/beta hydrolase [Vibrio variabilis]|uniref:alpha/beta hydrolase n=1 Tax=Vibrio variabilis TaxID=990271 RepID=UPI0013A68ECF|nr:alpha/beta hydrolase-fold protein [Vibrio variabilis]
MIRQVCLLLVTLTACTSLTWASTDLTDIIEIAAPSLQSSYLENTEKQQLLVALPPSYHLSNQRYPVVYYLHGYNGSIREASRVSEQLPDMLKEDPELTEMIVIGVNGVNQFGGSFYVNSPVTGNWEDFVTQDVINYVDSHYRTLKDPHYRGIAGFSMGGFATTNIALRHPDKFQHMHAFSAGLFDKQGLNDAVNQWQSMRWFRVLKGYAAAFAPMANAEKTPKWHNWDANDPNVIALWESGFGDIPAKLDRYLDRGVPLKSIRIEYGLRDQFPWIPKGSAYLVSELKKRNIEHEELAHDGMHSFSAQQGQNAIRFFHQSFKSQK